MSRTNAPTARDAKVPLVHTTCGFMPASPYSFSSRSRCSVFQKTQASHAGAAGERQYHLPGHCVAVFGQTRHVHPDVNEWEQEASGRAFKVHSLSEAIEAPEHYVS